MHSLGVNTLMIVTRSTQNRFVFVRSSSPSVKAGEGRVGAGDNWGSLNSQLLESCAVLKQKLQRLVAIQLPKVTLHNVMSTLAHLSMRVAAALCRKQRS